MGEVQESLPQVLTKRAEWLRDLLQSKLTFAVGLRHIWWGVSVENRKHGLPRVEHLRAARPAMTFLSIGPLLEDLGTLNLDGVDWVIVGGECGHGARPMREEWVVSIRQQCVSAGVPFFFKQWGSAKSWRDESCMTAHMMSARRSMKARCRKGE